MTNIIWFIPLLPVIGFVVTLLLGGKFGKFSSRLATVVLGICMFLSFYAAYLVFTRGEFSIEKIWYVTGDIKNRSNYLNNGVYTVYDHDKNMYLHLKTPKNIDNA